MKIRLYLDEDAPIQLAKVLRQRGIDALTTQEAGIIKKQMLRSSTSNIAEGYGGNKGNNFQNSLTIARREATETDYWLLLCFESGYIEDETHQDIENGNHEVRAMLSAFISRLKTPD